jgi:ribosomal protein S27E
MLKRKRSKKITTKEKARLLKDGNKFLTCKKCGIIEVKTNHDTLAVTCALCVAIMSGMPDKPKHLQRSGKPKGWHFKSYFKHDGKVYSRGEEVSDPTEIKELERQHKKTKPQKSNNPSSREKKRANTAR